MLTRRDFWAIFPVEGKHVMAAEFQRHRLKAVIFQKMIYEYLLS